MKPLMTTLLLLSTLACQGGEGDYTRRSSSLNSQETEASYDIALTAGDFTESDIAQLSVGELALLEQERRNQNLMEKEELELLDALNIQLCKRLNDLRQKCPATKRLIPDAYERQLQCQISQQVDLAVQEAAPSKQVITVTIPDDKTGSFVLIANDTLQSSPFGAGTSEITFKSLGSVNFLAPQFIQVYKLVLRPESENETLPDLDDFYFTLNIDDVSLIEEELFPSDDTQLRHEQREYKVPLQDILDWRSTSSCMVSDRELQELKTTIRSAIQGQQALARKQLYSQEQTGNRGGDDKQKTAIIQQIFALRTEIEQRFPILEAERDRQYKLSNELKTDVEIGCHAQEPLTHFELEVDGSLIGMQYVKTQKNRQPPSQGDGKSSELAFDFGAVKFSIDLAKQNILGVRYTHPKDLSDESLIGGLDRIVIRKKGVEFDNLRECKSVVPVFGQWEKCSFAVHEMNIVTINAISVYANGKKVFSGKDLRIRLDRENTQAVIEGFRMNENWIKLMQEKDCNQTS